MKQICNVRKLMLGLLTLVIVSMGYTQTIDKEKLDQLFDRLLEKNKGMGSIVIAKEGRIVYERAFGYSLMDGPTKTPITSNTRFRISSITKTYTAVMILQLVEEGKLKLQDNLDRFFPEIPNANKITIEQILRHRSGIPELKVEPNWGRQSRTHDEVLAVIEKGQPNFEPDSKHEYSNTGYVILGYIIEKVEGKPYQDVLKERITSKLGLKNTYLGEGNTNTEKNESLSYRYLGEWKEAPELNLSVPAGAGAIMSTPGDMAKFIQALFDHKLVSKASLDKMMTMQDGEGMGMEPFTFSGKTLYGHTGGSNSSGSWLAYEPEEQLALAYTTNAKIYPVADIVAAVFDIYWNRSYQVPTFEALVVSPEILDKYVGVYVVAGTPARMTVTRSGSTIAIENGGNTIPLEATAPDTFNLAPGVTVSFDMSKKQMTIKRPQGERVFTREE